MLQSTLPRSGTATAQLWIIALTLGGIGTALLFDSHPGLNWLLATMLTVLALVRLTRSAHRGGRRWERHAPAIAAVALAGGAALTSNGALLLGVAFGVLALFATSTVLHAGLPPVHLGPRQLLSAPFTALLLVARELAKRTDSGARTLLRNERTYLTLRAIALAAPVVVLLFLLLGAADPTLAVWQQYLANVFSNLSGLPRLFFFMCLSALYLGFFGIVLGPATRPAPSIATPTPRGTFTAYERNIVYGAVAALFSVFIVLQLSYLFGNPGGRAGSGITYAQAVHRGFAELTIAATLCACLIVVGDRYAIRGARETRTRCLAFTLVVECWLLLASSAHRLFAYQAAYGYTSYRLCVLIYVASAAMALALLAREIATSLNLVRLAHGIVFTMIVALCVPIYWNSAAWVARENLRRYQATGQIDIDYLTHDLSCDAVPAIVDALPRLPPDVAREIASRLHRRDACFGSVDAAHHDRWFEWNLRRAAARRALATLPAPPASAAAAHARLGSPAR
jgi:hypothetical protein